jgi:hypothetical protein
MSCNYQQYPTCNQLGCGCSNSHNHITNHTYNDYHARAIYRNHQHLGCCNTPHIVSTFVSAQAPMANCGCAGDLDCGGGGNSTTGNVPKDAPVGPYVLAYQLSPGNYMISLADNVAGGQISVGPNQIAKTIGTQFSITVPTDIFYQVTTPSSTPVSVRLTRI